MVAPFNKFYSKIWDSFCLNTGKPFFVEVFLKKKNSRKTVGSSKNGTRDFLNTSPFKRLACLYVTLTRDFEGFQYLNFTQQVFWQTKTFFQNWSTFF